MARGLTDKQRIFVAEYIVNLNATKAAIKAGYSQKTASRIGPELLGKTCVQAAIQEALKAREKRTGITADYVLTRLQTVVERCMQSEPVYDRKGEPTGDYQFDSSGANRALELLGKHLKLFTDKVEADNTNTNINADVTDDATRKAILDEYFRRRTGASGGAGR